MLLHVHMGGLIRPQTVWEIIYRTNSRIASSLDEIQDRMVFRDGDQRSMESFFNKFSILDEIIWHDWAIDLAIQQICGDLEKEKIEYSEISFSINKYMKHLGWTDKQVVRFICDSFSRHSRRFGITIGLLLSLKYESNRESQIDFASMIEDDDISECLTGIDLVGDETRFDAEFYEPIFRKWKRKNKILRAHVGEVPGCSKDNIEKAIRILGVSRIAHGIQATDEDLALARKNGVSFDIAIHSNICTGVVKDIKEHPLKRIIESGCKVTLNTDDPVMCGCLLDDEFSVAVKNGLITTGDIDIIQRNAVEAAARVN